MYKHNSRGYAGTSPQGDFMKYLGVLILFLCFVVVMMRCSTTSGNRPNSLGVNETYQNIYAYLLALPVDGQVLEGKVTSIRFKPFGAPALYDEDLLFCKDVMGMFDGKTGPVVVIYEKQAHSMYHGLACHELRNVFEVTIERDN